MDAITFLNKQHTQVDELFEKIENARSSQNKMKYFNEVADLLAVHASIEEKIFYPAVRAKDTEDILLESLEEHLSIKRVIADLLETKADDETFDAKAKVLKDLVQHHVSEEKKEMFPKVKKLFNKEELEAIGQELANMAQGLVGTSPRKKVPEETSHAAQL
jgi:hemerythrin superfamily protein